MSGDAAISIVRATTADADRIAAVHAELFERGWDSFAIATMVSGDAHLGLVALSPEGDVLGFALVQIVVDEGELLSIGVASRHQRSGIGHRMMEALLRTCLGAGVRHLHLDVAANNDTARALYGRHGFQVTGRRKDYYTTGEGRIDALQMRLDLV